MRRILALLSAGALLPAGALAQSPTGRAALDSVDRYIRAEQGILRVPLDAYEIIWLEPHRG